MNRVQKWVRKWLEIDHRDRIAEKTAIALSAANRQLSEIRGLLHQQTDVTVEALRKAGWQTEEDVAQQAALQRALRIIETDSDVIAGPWTGEVGFELLYWIPFLNWLVSQGLDGRRLIVISRGGAEPWYRHLTSRYVDVLDLVTPEEFLRRTSEGKRKQFSPKRELDAELIEKVRTMFGVPQASVVHPAAMFRLFMGLWRNRATINLVDAFTSFAPLSPSPERVDGLPPDLPPNYIVAKFYFSKAFPESSENRAFVADTLRDISRQAPVVLLSTAVRLDDHHDFRPSGHSGLFVVDALKVPQKNLAYQTQIIAGGRGFIGTYGGFSYLAPFYGVRSVSFFSRRNGFRSHHLDLANRVFDRLLPGGFVALDRRASDLVQPAVARWGRGGRGPSAAADDGHVASRESQGAPDGDVVEDALI